MTIDHIGIVVRSLDEGMNQWQDVFGYRKNSDIVTNSRQKVKVVFLTKKGSLPVKLLEPTASPVFQFARRGGGLHHLCFKCDDLKSSVQVLTQQGANFLVPPEPGEAFKNHAIAFFLLNNSLNVELIDTDEKTGWVEQHEGLNRPAHSDGWHQFDVNTRIHFNSKGMQC